MSEAETKPAEATPVETVPATDPSLPKTQLLAALPRLRAFALSLCGHADQADDLVQETLMKAWANLSSFEPGSNMPGWLYTILRNEFYSRLRKRHHEVDDPDGLLAAADAVVLPVWRRCRRRNRTCISRISAWRCSGCRPISARR